MTPMTEVRVGPRIALVSLLLAVGCDREKKDCEHARDVMAGEWERNAKEAIATVDSSHRAELQRQAAKEVEHLRGVFVERCVAQPEATKRCVARIDELLAAERGRKTALDGCAMDDEACHDKASKAADATLADCREPLDALMAAVNEGL